VTPDGSRPVTADDRDGRPPPDDGGADDGDGDRDGRRVVVTSPWTEAAQRAHRPRRRVDELADETDVGDVLIRSLIRAQLGLALRVLALLVVLLGGLPLAFAVAPSLGELEVGDVGLPWLLLGLASFPLLLLLGIVYVRHAERNERDFTELVER
jgi:hypothetical protein